MIAYIFAVFGALVSKLLTGLFGYSGEGTPPMYGDYEAQRHWMEITYHLPPGDWYFDTVENNLTYWGLDYPPLTAYHSYLMGALAHRLNPDFVRLGASRGHESADHKVFMRLTVVVCDLLLYTLGLCLYFKVLSESKNKLFRLNSVPKKYLFILLLYPGLNLVDHGHFQYNCVCLGLTALSVLSLIKNKYSLAASFYCLSFSYKQMTLYYSMAYFFYFVGKFFSELKFSVGKAFKNLIVIALTVVLTVFVVWFPFVTDLGQLKQVLHRVFPLYRGIFEDKVSNVWCLVNVFYKLKAVDIGTMALVCTSSVVLACLPSCLDLAFRVGKDRFILSLVNCSMAFFLFSFQVHEKTILMVSLPVLLVAPYRPAHSCWFLLVSTFSMSPLLIRDGLALPLALSQLLFTLIAFKLKPLSRKSFSKELPPTIKNFSNFILSICILSLLGSSIIFLLSVFCPPPKKYPDLFPLITSAYSAVHFLYFLLFFNYCQFSLAQVQQQIKKKE